MPEVLISSTQSAIVAGVTTGHVRLLHFRTGGAISLMTGEDEADRDVSLHAPDTDDLAIRFGVLVKIWREETTTPSSSYIDIVMHWAYQRIIGMGAVAVPMILAELRREPDHWGWALEAITGDHPIPPEAAGDVEAIAAAWLAWGDAHGLL